MKAIHHEFIDSLGQPILKEDVEIEVIDLIENFAEKFRALITRKNIAMRDIYDIYFILKDNILKINSEIIDLILIKINESKKDNFTKEDLIRYIETLDSKITMLDEKEIVAVIKTQERVDIDKMVQLIKDKFKIQKNI